MRKRGRLAGLAAARVASGAALLATWVLLAGIPGAAEDRDRTREPGATYRWRVDEVTADGIVQGPTWTFTTRPLSPRPAVATRRQPPVRILLVGDSTVTDELGWAPGFKARLASGVECANLARNGRSSRSYIGEGLWSAALEERADYVLIQFGHNDQPGKGPDRETTEVARFLMTIDKPSPAIVRAIEGAVSWIEAVAIKGWRVEMPPEPAAPNGHDRVVLPDGSAPPLWARFYQIGTNRPVYSGRDGVIKYSLAEIELERRSGYNWIDNFAATLLESDYPAWRKATGR